MKHIYLFIGIMLLAVSAMAQDISYRYTCNPDRYLDIYQPATPRADNACVVFLFGGGFYEGSRSDSSTIVICQQLAERGFVVAAVDYRLGIRGVNFDTVPLLQLGRPFAHAVTMAVEDCSAAIAFLWQRADELNINPNRICLMGSSAGAITVLQTDYARANSLPAAAALPKGFKPAVVAPYAGAILTGNHDLHYATPPAPTFFLHGTADKIVNYKRQRSSLSSSLFGSAKVVKEFQRCGYPYMIFRFPDRGHGVATYIYYTLDEFCAFVDMVAAGRPIAYDATCIDTTLPQYPWEKMSLFKLYLH